MRQRDRAVAHQAASLLLQYPDEQLVDRLPLLRRAVAELSRSVREPLARFLDYLQTTPLVEVQQHYVSAIDMRRRGCLYLSFWTHGDTRLRGRAILRFKQAYHAAGLELGDDELPDHLAVVLEFAAVGDPAAGVALLSEHRAALELIRSAFHKAGTPYADVIDAVCETLPPPSRDVFAKAAKIAAQGPPTELVGLGGPGGPGVPGLEPYPMAGNGPSQGPQFGSGSFGSGSFGEGSMEGIGVRR